MKGYIVAVLICISLVNYDLSILACAYWPFVYFLWRNIYSGSLPGIHVFKAAWEEGEKQIEEVDRAQLGGWLDTKVNAEFSSLGKWVDDGLSSKIAPVSPREGAGWRDDVGFGWDCVEPGVPGCWADGESRMHRHAYMSDWCLWKNAGHILSFLLPA